MQLSDMQPLSKLTKFSITFIFKLVVFGVEVVK